jgi:ketopantoate reductase
MEATLIGAGEVGRVFLRGAGAHTIRVVRRGDAIEPLPTGPIVVAVREEALAAVVPALRSVAPRCVFLQNGLVDDDLAPLGEVTRGIVWFTAKGSLFEELAPTAFHGGEAEAAASWLGGSGATTRIEPNEASFRLEIAKKLAWNNVAGLGPHVRGTTLGAYLADHRDEVRAIVDETLRVCAARWGSPVATDATIALLEATCRPIAHLRGGTSGLAWRNGAVARLGRSLGIDTPANDALLAQVRRD